MIFYFQNKNIQFGYVGKAGYPYIGAYIVG